MPTKVRLSGIEFGETYHIGTAMILTTSVPGTATCYGWKITYEEEAPVVNPITNAQKTFLDAILITPTYSANTTGTVGTQTLAKSNCTQDIIAPAFTNDPGVADTITNCFLSETLLLFDATNGSMYSQMDHFIRSKYPIYEPCTRAIIRIRDKTGQNRNITAPLVTQIANSLKTNAGVAEILFVGDTTLVLPAPPANVVFHDLRGFLNETVFKNIAGTGKPNGSDFSFAAQLMFYRVLENNFHVKMQIGMMSGAMDGTAFIGIPTIFFEEHTGVALPETTRMGQAAAAIPWLEQVVYLGINYDSTNPAKYQMPAVTITALDAAIARLK